MFLPGSNERDGRKHYGGGVYARGAEPIAKNPVSPFNNKKLSRKPLRAIQYAAPTSISDAVSILTNIGARARVLAGGTDLIPQVNEYMRDVDVVVDCKRIPEVMELSFSSTNGLTIGAAVPCYRIYENRDVQSHYAGIADAASIIGSTGIQGRASLGGNLCNSGPAADSIPPLIAYSAIANIAGPNGNRSVAVENFCTAPGRNVLQSGEMLISLQLPAPPSRSGGRYIRFIPRNEMDIAEVGVGAYLELDADGTILRARIALAAVAPKPLFVAEAGDSLIGKSPSETAFAEAAAIAKAAATPITDMRGTAEHRKHLVGVITRRALSGAFERIL
jgi:CO/xanthine dehydrogenase FAD-binding subunit